MKKLIAATLLLLSTSVLSTNALATFDGGTAKIEKVLVYEQGDLVYIFPEGGVQNAPSCHGSNGDYVSFRMNRRRAKEYLSVLLTAFMAQKPVEFRIEESCIDQSISATLSYFIIHK